MTSPHQILTVYEQLQEFIAPRDIYTVYLLLSVFHFHYVISNKLYVIFTRTACLICTLLSICLIFIRDLPVWFVLSVCLFHFHKVSFSPGVCLSYMYCLPSHFLLSVCFIITRCPPVSFIACLSHYY